MIPTPDPECNQVTPSMSGNPDLTYRCRGPEGHDVHGPFQLMLHKHRAPVETVTTPFGPPFGSPAGGRHRAYAQVQP